MRLFCHWPCPERAAATVAWQRPGVTGSIDVGLFRQDEVTPREDVIDVAPEGMSDDANGPDTTPSTTDTIEPYAQAYAADVPSSKPKNPAATAYKGVFYDNDFSYLDAPNNTTFYPGDGFKQIHVGDCWIVDERRAYRLRQEQEHDMRGNRLDGQSDNFLLQRTRLFVNAKKGNWLRVYGEAIDATSSWENFVPRGIDENRFDALNLFADVYCTTRAMATTGDVVAARNCCTANNGSCRRSTGQTPAALLTAPRSSIAAKTGISTASGLNRCLSTNT